LYLGFEFMLDEYKVMGMASFGDSRKYYDDVFGMVSLREDGLFTVPVLARNASLIEHETHRGCSAPSRRSSVHRGFPVSAWNSGIWTSPPLSRRSCRLACCIRCGISAVKLASAISVWPVGSR